MNKNHSNEDGCEAGNPRYWISSTNILRSLGWILMVILFVITCIFIIELLFNITSDYLERKTDVPGLSTNTVEAAMTAIGTAVGVITLMLALGTFYIDKKREELEILEKKGLEREEKLDQLEQKSKQREELFNAKMQLEIQWSKVQLSLMIWVSEQTESPETIAMMANEIGIYLRLLQSESLEVRKMAFDALLLYPWPWQDEFPDNLQPVKDYTELCQRFHTRDLPEAQQMSQCGMWCLIFAEQEVAYRKTLPWA